MSMKRQINAKVAEWTPEIQAFWEEVISTHPDADHGPVLQANYFTPRPYRNEYDRGDTREGFTYTIGREVWQIHQEPNE